MSPSLNRREFVAAGAAALAGAKALTASASQAPAVATRGNRPVVIASANGHRYKNGGTQTCVEHAFQKLTTGTDVLEALVAGVGIVELDPEDSSVGFGGLPNADGVVQLDAACMHGPRKRAGAVAALEGVRTPSRVALRVMEETDHHLLVGKGAQDFARAMGFTIEEDLNTPKSRQLWLEWKRRMDPEHWLDPKKRAEAAMRVGHGMVAEGLIDPEHYYGTINCSGIGAKGELASVTTTSGLAWKIPGRVGDSPILGAGLYAEDRVGAAGSTGRGEANLFGLSSYLIIELLRQGRHPKDAGLETLRRIESHTIEKRLKDGKGRPDFQVDFYILDARGEYAGVSMFPSTFAVCTENGAEIQETTSRYSEWPSR